MWSQAGELLTLQNACKLTDNGNITVKNLTNWSRVRVGVASFHFASRPTTNIKRQRAELQVTTIVANYPHTVMKPQYAAEVRLTAHPNDHPVTVTLQRRPMIEAVIHTGSYGPYHSVQVDSHAALLRHLTAIAEENFRILAVRPHPILNRLVCLWAGGRRWTRTRKHYKTRNSQPAHRRGVVNKEKRAAKWVDTSTAAAAGLAALPWKSIRRIIGLGPWGEQSLLRLKWGAFSMYDVSQNKAGCPHKPYPHIVDTDIYHVYWGCPAAMKLRRVLLTPWRGLDMSEEEVESSIFGLKLSRVPEGIWKVAEQLHEPTTTTSVAFVERVEGLTDNCWRLGAATYFHAVWRWRVEHFDKNNNVTDGHHTTALQSRLLHGYETVRAHMYSTSTRDLSNKANAVLRTPLLKSEPVTKQPEPPHSAAVYLLFFDGGSRDNPGPGGSGSIVIRSGHPLDGVKVCWIDSLSLANKKTTNNVAKNLGLYIGHKACADKRYTPLEVIGDSAMIIRQQREETTQGTSPQTILLEKQTAGRQHSGVQVAPPPTVLQQNS